jgi:hypothetical protein
VKWLQRKVVGYIVGLCLLVMGITLLVYTIASASTCWHINLSGVRVYGPDYAGDILPFFLGSLCFGLGFASIAAVWNKEYMG